MDDPVGTFFIRWGFLIWGTSIVLSIAMFWAHGVNQKLEYLLTQVEGRAREEFNRLMKAQSSSAQKTNMVSKRVSPILGICIIGAAILFMLIIPIWLRNR